MHELSVCYALLDQVKAIALEINSPYVTSIVIGIGPLSGVDAQLLKNAYTIARAGSVAKQAELIIEILPVKVKCGQCGCVSEVLVNKMTCQSCGNWQTTLVSGDELLLMSVEIETEEDSLVAALH